MGACHRERRRAWRRVLSTDEGAGTYSDLVYRKPQSVELERRFLQADPKPDPACGRFDVECESFLIAGGGQTGSDPRTGRGRTRKTNGGNGTGVLRRWGERWMGRFGVFSRQSPFRSR